MAEKPAVTLYDKSRKGYPRALQTLGDHIRKRRLDLGLTLHEAAARIGTKNTLLHEWEKNRKRPAEWWRRPIADFLGYDPFGTGVEGLPGRGEGKTEMPKLTVEGSGTFDVPQGKRLVLALVDEAHIDQLHACGGNARCTTCRVQFVDGEPETSTQAEKELLAARGLSVQPGLRLSCQILCNHDIVVRAISRLAGSGRADVGKRPADSIQPPPVWTT